MYVFLCHLLENKSKPWNGWWGAASQGCIKKAVQ